MALQNGVFGEPQIFCGPEGIHVLVHTKEAFRGRLFVAEEADRPECIHSYVDSEDSTNSAEFHIKFGGCNMRRQRTLSPRGVSFSFVLVTSFHSTFLTGSDRAFNVRCFFVEAVKGVESQLQVNQLVTELVQQEFTLPQCNYYLKSTHESSSLRFASIGDSVTHVWECDSSAAWLYGLLIHSCYVDDGRGNKFELVDQHGCAVDRMLLNDIVYEENGVNAYVNSHVFKYADRVQLFFTCTVQLCFKEDGGCSGITPPQCGHGQPIPPLAQRKFVNHDSVESQEHSEPHRSLTLQSVQERQRAAHNLFKSIPRRGLNLPGAPKLSPRLKDDPDKDIEKLVQDGSENDLNKTLSETNDTVTEGKRLGRDALNFMETDLSTELTVMPLDEEIRDQKPRETISTLPYVNHPAVCISRVGVFTLASVFVLILFGTALMSVVLYNRRKQVEIAAQTRKIYLTE
ncbi:unnamed protein product [Bursaphelenchus okinawaensis]|uniref:ZP domain-containing protein n=1 Tax=Bursaphelenchus okinawaensis TaxID=465554 RepID=A0A811KSN6_9BILA|nr:unnamed protein product [Bursaphelenchus okinawaensis]CAG9109873.1 unnamed protein product [Bursaphelenchus okinawaensis]